MAKDKVKNDDLLAQLFKDNPKVAELLQDSEFLRSTFKVDKVEVDSSSEALLEVARMADAGEGPYAHMMESPPGFEMAWDRLKMFLRWWSLFRMLGLHTSAEEVQGEIAKEINSHAFAGALKKAKEMEAVTRNAKKAGKKSGERMNGQKKIVAEVGEAFSDNSSVRMGEVAKEAEAALRKAGFSGTDIPIEETIRAWLKPLLLDSASRGGRSANKK